LPRQQLFELVGRVLGDAGEDVSEPGLRINVVQFARLCRPPNYVDRACFPHDSL
jgi:hypothetical protein